MTSRAGPGAQVAADRNAANAKAASAKAASAGVANAACIELPKIRPFARAGIVGPRLLALIDATNTAERIAGDPLEFPRRYSDPLDIEVSALLSAAVAYGRVDLFKPRLRALLESLGPAPGAVARDRSPAELLFLCRDFHYRMTGPLEVATLLAGAGRLARAHGTLGQAFSQMFIEAGEPTIRGALGKFVDALLEDPSLPRAPSLRSAKQSSTKSAEQSKKKSAEQPSRRMKHLLPHPSLGSACKRLNLFLRWMVRGPDGIDLGIWKEIPPAALVIPLDTHVHRISGLVGLTRRKDLSWRTAEEITSRLRALDARDPVRYDFSLSHLGISGGCPSRRDQRKCVGCPLQPVCKHWA